jgi:hypothetical protein
MTKLELSTANLNVSGDDTTWDVEAGACCTRAEGPPKWHSSLEVVEDHLMAAGRNRNRRLRWERSPFDHEEQQRARRHEEAPRRSIVAPLLQTWTPPGRGKETPFFLTTMTRGKRRLPDPTEGSRTTQIFSLIDGGFHCSLPHHLRLLPTKLHGEEKNSKTAWDPAGEIPRQSPGI